MSRYWCAECKYGNRDGSGEPCVNCVWKNYNAAPTQFERKGYPLYLDYPKPCKPLTNADYIRAMTDEEWASFLALIELTHFPQRSITTELEKSYDKWFAWLRQEG